MWAAVLVATTYFVTTLGQSCSVSQQDCGAGKFCNHDYGDTGHCNDCSGVDCSNPNLPDDRSPCCASQAGTCSVSQQDCGAGKFCNHDYGDTGHCQGCGGIDCSNPNLPGDRSPCCNHYRTTQPAGTCSVSQQDCGAGKFCNHDYGDTGHCNECGSVDCSDPNLPGDRSPCCSAPTCDVMMQTCGSGRYCRQLPMGGGTCTRCEGVVCSDATYDQSPCCPQNPEGQSCADDTMCGWNGFCDRMTWTCKTCASYTCTTATDPSMSGSVCCRPKPPGSLCNPEGRGCGPDTECKRMGGGVGKCMSCKDVTCTPGTTSRCCNQDMCAMVPQGIRHKMGTDLVKYSQMCRMGSRGECPDFCRKSMVNLIRSVMREYPGCEVGMIPKKIAMVLMEAGSPDDLTSCLEDLIPSPPPMGACLKAVDGIKERLGSNLLRFMRECRMGDMGQCPDVCREPMQNLLEWGRENHGECKELAGAISWVLMQAGSPDDIENCLKSLPGGDSEVCEGVTEWLEKRMGRDLAQVGRWCRKGHQGECSSTCGDVVEGYVQAASREAPGCDRIPDLLAWLVQANGGSFEVVHCLDKLDVNGGGDCVDPPPMEEEPPLPKWWSKRCDCPCKEAKKAKECKGRRDNGMGCDAGRKEKKPCSG